MKDFGLFTFSTIIRPILMGLTISTVFATIVYFSPNRQLGVSSEQNKSGQEKILEVLAGNIVVSSGVYALVDEGWQPAYSPVSCANGNIAKAVVQVESYLRPQWIRQLEQDAAGLILGIFGYLPNWSLGLAQVKPSTARESLHSLGIPLTDLTDAKILEVLSNPCQNASIASLIISDISKDHASLVSAPISSNDIKYIASAYRGGDEKGEGFISYEKIVEFLAQTEVVFSDRRIGSRTVGAIGFKERQRLDRLHENRGDTSEFSTEWRNQSVELLLKSDWSLPLDFSEKTIPLFCLSHSDSAAFPDKPLFSSDQLELEPIAIVDLSWNELFSSDQDDTKVKEALELLIKRIELIQNDPLRFRIAINERQFVDRSYFPDLQKKIILDHSLQGINALFPGKRVDVAISRSDLMASQCVLEGANEHGSIAALVGLDQE